MAAGQLGKRENWRQMSRPSVTPTRSRRASDVTERAQQPHLWTMRNRSRRPARRSWPPRTGSTNGGLLILTLAPVIRARANLVPAKPQRRQSRRRFGNIAKQQSAGAMQAGHDRPDRHAGYLGDLAIAELLQLAQHDRLA